MAYVVAEPCVGCTFTDCVEVCPVDCFYVGPNFIAIHPDECINCNACVPVCPVDAIYAEDELPEKWAHYAEWNAYLAPRWQALGHNLVETRRSPRTVRAPSWRGLRTTSSRGPRTGTHEPPTNRLRLVDTAAGERLHYV